MQANTTICALMMATALAGCSTRPRNFAAQVAVPSEDLATFEDNYRTCGSLVAQGHRSGFRDAALTWGASGAGAAAGASVALGTAGLIGGTYSSFGAAMGTAGAAMSVAMPGVGFLVGFGVSRMIRSGNERRFRRAMTDCLGEFGYQVDGWERLERKADAAAAARSMVLERSLEPTEDAGQLAHTVGASDAMPDPQTEPAELVLITEPVDADGDLELSAGTSVPAIAASLEAAD